jgi:hypothetical protein
MCIYSLTDKILKMNYKILIFLIVMLSTFISCSLLINGRYGRDKLTMNREPMSSNSQFKTAGMYSRIKNNSSSNIIFFRNGIVLYANGSGYFSKNDLARVEDDFRKITKDNNPYHDVVYAWGVFKIKGDSLKIESWMSGEFGEKYRAGIWNGRILNDSTYVLNNYPTTINGYPFVLDEMGKRSLRKPYFWLDTFRFVKLSVKPDSTCPFIN